MAVYVISQVEVTNPEPYQEYVKGVPATVEKYGGRFLVRGGEMKRYSGEWAYSRVVVIEFDSAEKAEAWHDSPEYKAVALKRAGAALVNSVMAEGA